MWFKLIKNRSTLVLNRRSNHAYALVIIIATALSMTAIPTQAAGLSDLFGNNKSATASKFLPVDQAFQVTSNSQAADKGTSLTIDFSITPGHYVYRDQIKLTLPTGVSAAPFTFTQKSVSIDDPTFGQVAIFDQANMAATTLLTSDNGQSMSNATVTIGWQGCAKAGLCYPPEQINTTVSIAATPSSIDDQAVSKQPTIAVPTSIAQSAPTNDKVIDNVTLDAVTLNDATLDSALAAESEMTNTLSGADNRVVGDDTLAIVNNSSNSSENNGLKDNDPFGLTTHPWLAFGLLFIAGLLLALTPCVLPMLPIVANIVARQQNPTVKKSVILISSYAIGVSTAYGMLGALVAVFGVALGVVGWFQNPVILISFALVFIALAFYMLGIVTLRLPSAVSKRMQRFSQAADSKLGSIGGSLVAGFLSALVISPCVSAPLSGALVAVSTIGSPLLGFVALFILGFGLSTPLILIAATQGKMMPQAGEWMNWVKQGFALLLFAVALLLIERVFLSPAMLLIWALWFMVVATWAWRWLGKGHMFTQALALVVGIWATILIVGAALGNHDSLHPLASLSNQQLAQNQTASLNTGAQANQQITDLNRNTNAGNNINTSAKDRQITTLAELDKIIAANPKVIVDVTAEWCIECRIMDKNLFHNPPLQMQKWQLVHLDITQTNEDSKAILNRYQLFGPPALLYYQKGQLVHKQVGDIGRQQFEQTLTSLQ